MKVVSLLPAATEIVCALGLRDSLAGRSHGCDFPAGLDALPVLTRARVDASLSSADLDAQVRGVVEARLPMYTLDEAALEAIAPDVVVTQEACDVCAVSYEQVIGALDRASSRTRVVSLAPARLDDIFEDVRKVADACGVSARGDAVSAELRRRVAVAAPPAARPPRVVVIEWLAPVMLAGHWVPDAVIVAPCGFDLERTRRESAPYAADLRSLAPRVLLLDGNAFLNRPGPRIVDAIETVAAWLRGAFVRKGGGRDLALDLVR